MSEPAILTEQSLALAAAGQASEGLAQLLRFVKEGPHSDHFAFEEETVELLADALKLAIEVEHSEERRAHRRKTFGPGGVDEAEMLGQLRSALVRFLEGWAG